GDGRELDLVFRGGGPRKAAKGKRRFSIDPDAPTGVAGHVFVTGDMVRIERSSAIYDFGLDSDGDSSTSVFEGLISVPIVDWEQNGTPLGVVYVSTSTVRGRLFALKDDIPAGGPELGLRDLYVWLQEYGLGIVRAMTL
ncbi:MAG: hypothetical protein KC432_12910, partial [Thermomicrobiales bacterium]|nr:hypothetical protein [Thermomicrobiales bacterium]